MEGISVELDEIANDITWVQHACDLFFPAYTVDEDYYWKSKKIKWLKQ